VDVTDKFKQTGVCMAGDGFVMILEEVSGSFVLEVEDNFVSGNGHRMNTEIFIHRGESNW
jgi:hypothetical protein